MEDIHAVSALHDQISRVVVANMTQGKMSDFFKTI